jgi:hypothetical protein
MFRGCRSGLANNALQRTSDDPGCPVLAMDGVLARDKTGIVPGR